MTTKKAIIVTEGDMTTKKAIIETEGDMTTKKLGNNRN